jgi:tetratricopeptide (TPR) repeat protein
MENLGSLCLAMERPAEAEKLITDVLAINGRTIGEKHPWNLSPQLNLAKVYSAQNKLGEAERMFAEVRRNARDRLGPDDGITVSATAYLASRYENSDRLREAEKLFNEVRESHLRVSGPENWRTLQARRNLAWNHHLQNRDVDATAEFRELLATERRVLSDQNPETLSTRKAFLRLSEALLNADMALEITSQWAASPDTVMAGQLEGLGRTLLDQHRYPDAERVLRACLAMRDKVSPDDWSRFSAQSRLGESVFGQKKYADAESLIVQGYDGLKARQGSLPADGQSALNEAGKRVVRLYDQWGQGSKAAEWRNKLQTPRDPKDPDG